MINLNLILFHGLRCYLVGMGIGLVFYGAVNLWQILLHLLIDPKTTEAYTEALRSTFFHWGFHAWVVWCSCISFSLRTI